MRNQREQAMTNTAKFHVPIRIVVPVAIVVLLVALGLAGQIATLKPIHEAQSVAAISNGGVAFSKVEYVDKIWESRVLPTARDTSVPLDTLVGALEKNPKSAGERYGHDVGGAYSFLVHFTGKVTKVDSSSPIGKITVNVPFSGSELPVKVQIGPVIMGTAIRDALKFISFEQFLNQMQYGGVADQLNTQVEKTVVSKLDLKTLTGKEIEVRGAFTYDGTNAKNLLVTPIIVTME